MLGIGYQEMIVIMVIGLIVFGPGKLPEVAGQLGKAVRDFRRMTSDLTGEFEKSISVADDVKRSVRKEVGSVTSQVSSVSQSVKKDLAKTGGSTTSAAKAGGSTIKSASGKAAGKTGEGAATVTATKADPLADVSLLDAEPETVAAPAPAKTNGRATPRPSRVKTLGKVAAETTSTNPPATTADQTPAGTPDDAPRAPVTSAQPASAATNDGGSGDVAGALTRARQRRAAAGYHQPRQ